MKIENYDLNRDIMIIAEIGNNHEGSFMRAEEMIGLAARAGASAVKFQTIIPEELVSYQDTERLAQLKRFSLSYDQYEKLSQVAKRENVLFLSTPFDLESVRRLSPFVPAFKIASGDNDFYPLIRSIAETAKPIMLSSGLLHLHEIQRVRNFIWDIWKEHGIRQDLAVLHCIVSYPTPAADANLLAIREIEKLNVTVGYSDHTLGIEAAVLAVALGARIIEKHFTIDRHFSDFHDHQIASDPSEFKRLVERIKEATVMLGDGVKSPSEREQKAMVRVRRSVVAKRDLAKGTVLSYEDLSWVRPGGGLCPGDENRILGKVLVRAVKKGDRLQLEDVLEAVKA